MPIIMVKPFFFSDMFRTLLPHLEGTICGEDSNIALDSCLNKSNSAKAQLKDRLRILPT